MICKIDPADVVSVPLDSEHQKVRCCKYEVVGEYDGDLIPAVVDYYDDEDDDWDEDDDNYTYSEVEQDYEDSWNDE
jgi:broad specificity phosphatase PhoE